MRHAHTLDQVRTAEAARRVDLPDGALMARAAAGLAAALVDHLGGAYGRRVLLLVGSGDNGGDALHAGARLARRGARVSALLVADRAHEDGLAAFRAAGGRVVDAVPAGLDVVVDAIVGIGGRPGLREAAQRAVDAVRGVPVVAVDVPSGVDVDTGETPEPHVRADLTITFGTHKVAHLVEPAASACGAVHLVDDLDLDLPEAAVTALQPADVRRLVPVPAPDAQKYTRGVVGVRAGSAVYPGAALLCVAGAASGLAGMTRYVGSEEAAARVHAAHPEVVGGGRVQAWVVGPGTDTDAGAALAAALADGVPTVVDADALAHVTGPAASPLVLTPHAGELSRMTGAAREDVEAAPLAHARAAARQYDAVVLLKGRHTLVAAPDGRVRVTTTGVPWLATAGAGDVLAGLVGALLAAGLDPFDAASVGSWVHGAAATLASRGGPVVAGDVAAALPEAVRGLVGRMGESGT
ncbi:NAD(P)H-hydrate dehydratase [uncultured Nocardioides sp.]|uniref:NAD(P)H-hydrate dehydratase n=1 Tax=uncultured Nocardioides sp. TaxID=198441 RepID=UPI0025ED801A|nr:NAD(P)H-hydrate dehydratase [uncultured Nocardioides sp.]